MQHSAVTLALTLPMAIAATGAAAWLLHAEVTALEAALNRDTPPPAVADSYRPGPGWMHRNPPGFGATPPARVSPLHALTNAGVSPTLVRWMPLP
jgi:hypothetical protein